MTTPTMKKDQAQQHTEKARDAAAGAADKVKEAASHAGQAATAAAQGAREAASQAVSTATDKARDLASQAGQAISSGAATVGHKAEDATATVGHGIQSLADTVREKGPESGVLGRATESVASTLESTGRYIEDKNLSGMANDLTNLIRNNPIPALLVGLGVGFLLGRAMRS